MSKLVAAPSRGNPSNTHVPLPALSPGVFTSQPTEVLITISRFLPRNDQIALSATCIKLFNIRYTAPNSPSGMVLAQVQKSFPLGKTAFQLVLNNEGKREPVSYIPPLELALKLCEIKSAMQKPEILSEVTTLRFHISYYNAKGQTAEEITPDELAAFFSTTMLPKLNTLVLECEVGRIPEILFENLARFSGLKSLTLHTWYLNSIPASINLLKNIRILNIHSHYSHDETYDPVEHIPPQIGELENLKILNIDIRWLGKLPSEIGNLINLRHLKIDASANLGHLPPEIGKLNNLRSLVLNTYSLEDLPVEIGQLKSLHFLSIQSDSSRKFNIGPQELEKLTNLQILVVDGTPLTSLPVLPNLWSLTIKCEGLINLPLGLGKLSALQSLLITVRDIHDVLGGYDSEGFPLYGYDQFKVPSSLEELVKLCPEHKDVLNLKNIRKFHIEGEEDDDY